MMLSHPVLLGFLWSLLILSTSGQPQISDDESSKVYAYSYHFQHNGTTNSRDILKNFLGVDPDFGLGTPDDGKSIVKTFSSPGIRGFFTKGVLPAGPLGKSFADTPFNSVRNFVESNLHPPRNVAPDILPPISPDISREFPGDFSGGNNLFQDDFPKIPPPPPPVVIPNGIGGGNVEYPKIPSDVGHNRNVEDFSRDTPDGGHVLGRVETFSYNPPPVSNSISRTEESSEGFRRNENILNSNREQTGYRTQSFFRTNFRTMTPNLESNTFNQHSKTEHRNSAVNNNSNQWWNVLNVLGNGRSNQNPTPNHANRDISENINNIRDNINRAFGARLSGFRRQNSEIPVNSFNNNRQDKFARQNRDGFENRNFGNPLGNQNFNSPPLNQNARNQMGHQNFNNPPVNQNFNKPLGNQNFEKPVFNNNPTRNQNHHSPPGNLNFESNPNVIPNIEIIPFNRAEEHRRGRNENSNPNPAFNSNPVGISNNNVNPPIPNRVFNSQHDKDVQNRVMNLIQGVSSHLKDLHNSNRRSNSIGQTWDDESGLDRITNFNQDWSARTRPFSNGHSGPANFEGPGPRPSDVIKKTFDSLAGNSNLNDPRNQGNSYRNVNGGGVEKFFGFDRTVDGPNSFSRNQQRGYERDFNVNSDSGYERANQWSTNTVRRLDAQSSKADFSTDFIDVFNDD